MTDAHRTGLLRALGLFGGDGGVNGDGAAAPLVDEVADAVGLLTVEEVLSALRSEGVPVAVSVHPSAVPDDPQVVARELLRRYRHPAAGRFVQVGLPLVVVGGRAGGQGSGTDAGARAATDQEGDAASRLRRCRVRRRPR